MSSCAATCHLLRVVGLTGCPQRPRRRCPRSFAVHRVVAGRLVTCRPPSALGLSLSLAAGVSARPRTGPAVAPTAPRRAPVPWMGWPMVGRMVMAMLGTSATSPRTAVVTRSATDPTRARRRMPRSTASRRLWRFSENTSRSSNPSSVRTTSGGWPRRIVSWPCSGLITRSAWRSCGPTLQGQRGGAMSERMTKALPRSRPATTSWCAPCAATRSARGRAAKTWSTTSTSCPRISTTKGFGRP
mmetsp:Transcript_9572/g.30433  ORF Transcript_9572/g.30433 Transcript_9572/m.30433 type:complete len:243 (-) Transcript_9572:366-1094(-)